MPSVPVVSPPPQTETPKSIADALDGHATDPAFEVTCHCSKSHANEDAKWRCKLCSAREDSGIKEFKNALHIKLDLVFDKQDAFMIDAREIAQVIMRHESELIDVVARAFGISGKKYKEASKLKRLSPKRKRL